MSSHHEHTPWLDRYWQPLVILFGILFVAFLVFFKPFAA